MYMRIYARIGKNRLLSILLSLKYIRINLFFQNAKDV